MSRTINNQLAAINARITGFPKVENGRVYKDACDLIGEPADPTVAVAELLAERAEMIGLLRDFVKASELGMGPNAKRLYLEKVRAVLARANGGAA